MINTLVRHYKLIGWTILIFAVFFSTIGLITIQYLIYQKDIPHSVEATGTIVRHGRTPSFWRSINPVVKYTTKDGNVVQATLREDHRALPKTFDQNGLPTMTISIWYRTDNPKQIHFNGPISWPNANGLAISFFYFWILLGVIAIFYKIKSFFKRHRTME